MHGLLEDFAHGRGHGCTVKVEYWGFDPPPRRQGRRGRGRIGRVVDTPYVDPVSAAVLRTVELLDEVGAERLRVCECGRIFLAVRRQRHCTPEHARRAAWRAYVTREGVAAKRKMARA